MKPLRGLFVTGTDTGVGKTYLAAAIVRDLRARGVRAGAYKPACSGSERGPDGGTRWADVDALAGALGPGADVERVCPQRFHAPLAPPVAAREEGRAVDAGLLRAGARWWEGRAEALIVEGAGGLLSPLAESESVADLAAELGFPLLVVARLGLGTINHTLLTVEAARRRGLRVAGVVLNDVDPQRTGPERASNPSELARRCPAPVLGVLPFGCRDGGLLRGGHRIRMDWLALSATAHR